MQSIWADVQGRTRFDKLKQDIKTDVLIVGGGIAGILCAYMLEKSGTKCVIAEADRICGGITKNTTAKITYQHGLIYSEIIDRYGIDKARLYLESQKDALEQYRNLSKKIACDFEECDSVVYCVNDKEKVKNEVLAYKKLGVAAEFDDTLPLPFDVAGAVRVKNQAQFHPLKFLFSAAKDLQIYENTRVLEITGDGALTDGAKIKAEKIIVATHFPFINKYGGYFLKMYQHRSYVLALKNVPDLKDMYVDEEKTGMSFRSYDGLMLIGGGGHRTGKKSGGWQELSEFAKKHYPKAEEVARWATQDCMTLDGIPYIGRYSKKTPSVYVATGFNKWGMTSAMSAAMILTDLICGRKNVYASVFDPSRSMMHPQLAVNAAESIMNILTPAVPRCPHMGCALKYNKYEHSWDCPCHGSRFTEEGKLIDNPATGNANTGK